MLTLQQVVDRYPGLSAFGFDAKPRYDIKAEQFEMAQRWLLENQVKALPRAGPQALSSSALKHTMEEHLQADRGYSAGRAYTTNGAFIAAALSLSIPFRRGPERSDRNAYFGISKLWARRIYKEINGLA
jgi:hypothetical protein